MKCNYRLLILAALFALALPLFFGGNAGATYLSDGARPNGTTGSWDLPADLGSCYTGTIAGGAVQDLTKNPSECRDTRDASVAAETNKTVCTTAGFKWQYGCADGTAGCCWPNWKFAGTYNGNDQCLRCHNTAYMVGHAPDPAPQAAKESYLKTGHKNMLRKVTAGQSWAGPDSNGNLAIYTTDGSHAIDFATGTVNIPTASCSDGVSPNQATCEAAGKTWTDSGNRPLFYIYGDWMAINPTLVYGRLNSDSLATNGYSCGACHTSGFSNSSAGLCSNNTSTTEAACTSAGATWVWSVGVQGVDGLEPGATYPGIKGITGKWDLNGIQCSRCHSSTYPAVTGTSTHNNTPAGLAVNNLCFGCHQSMGKVWPAGTSGSIDPTVIPVGVSHGAAYGRDFNGHVLGNSFLNSPHARFSGTVVPNKLGKFDLGSAGTYSSNFEGGTGNCATCHDVHQSLFVAGQNGIKEECVGCHENSLVAAPQINEAALNHPKTTGTPWDTSLFGNDPCAVCHMAIQAKENGDQNSMPVHVWRINTDSSYNTFPSMAQFYGGSCSVHSGAVQNSPSNPVVYLSDTSSANCTAAGGTWTTTAKDRNAQTAADNAYANAVWVDLDLACGQCHVGDNGGTIGQAATGAPAFTKAQLSAAAKALHDGGDPTQCLSCHSIQQGDYRPVVQSGPTKNHHSGVCSTCHTTQHTGNPLIPNTLNANILKPAGSHNPLPYWSINSTQVVTPCLSCHSTPKTRSADGSTLGAIVPSGSSDNHHNGHSSVPGTSFGGVSEANGSRGDNDPGMNCLGCHGKSTIVSGDNTIGYVVRIAASGLNTSTVAANNGRGNTTGLCLGCHQLIQSGAGQDHHSGACTTCHHPDGSWSGTYPAGVGSGSNILATIDPNSRDSVLAYCQACHVTAQTKSAGGTARAIVPSGTGDNHHQGSSTSTARSVAGCLYCHGETGGVPFGTATNENMQDAAALGNTGSCSGACHADAQANSGKHHTGEGLALTNNTLCLTCHDQSGSRVPRPGVPGDVVMNPLSRDNVTNYCLACHSSAQGAFRAIVPTGAGDNHHRGSGTSTSNSVAGCLYCHGSAGGVKFGTATNENMVDAAALGNTGSCSGSCHASAQANSGAHHTGAGLPLTNNTLCLTCHTPNSAVSEAPGVTDPAVYPLASWQDCSACHSYGVAPNGPMYAPHHNGTPSGVACSTCHTNAGQLPSDTTCQTCHTTYTLSGMTHPYRPGTPSTCITCHRDANPAPIDVQTECGQCHNPAVPPAPAFTSAQITSYSAGMHRTTPVAEFGATNSTTVSYRVDFISVSTCPTGDTCTYAWDFTNDGVNEATGTTASNVYAGVGPYTAKLTVTDTTTSKSNSVTHVVNPAAVTAIAPLAPTAAHTAAAVAGMKVSFTDQSTDPSTNDPSGIRSITIAWGDGITGACNVAGLCSHTYATAGTYSITQTATNMVGLSNSATPFSVIILAPAASTYAVSGTVRNADGTVMSGASLALKVGTTVQATTTSSSSGTYSFTGIANGSYNVAAFKSGQVFDPASKAVTVSSANVTGVDFQAVKTKFNVTIDTGTPGVSGALVKLLQGTTLKKYGYTDANGDLTLTNVVAGTYTVQLIKAGVTFGTPSPASVVIVNGTAAAPNPADPVVTVTHTP